MHRFRLTVLLVCGIFTAAASAAAAYYADGKLPHYDTRTDLSVHFSNSDAVITKIRQGLRQRDDTIILTYRSHSDHMGDVGAIVRDLMSFAVAETERPDEGDYIFQQSAMLLPSWTKPEPALIPRFLRMPKRSKH